MNQSARCLRWAADFLRNTRSKGLRHACRYARVRLIDRLCERRLGICTEGTVSTSELGFTDPACAMYAPIGYEQLRSALSLVTIRQGEDVLLDYGAGKGRVVIVAGTYPFRKVIGIELSESLLAIARDNLKRASNKLLCRDIQLVHANALHYRVPDDVTILFFYNSFAGHVLQSAMEEIHRSLIRMPRRLQIICCNPSRFDEQARTRLWIEKTRAGVLFHDMGVAVYECRTDRLSPTESAPKDILLESAV